MNAPPLATYRSASLLIICGLASAAKADGRNHSPWLGPEFLGPAIVVAMVLLAFLVFFAWVWCLVSAAKNGKWVWFVLMLIFQVLFIFYLLFAHKHPPLPPSSPSPNRRREPYLDR